ncbi:hypothetical protein RFI_25879, partial [Reticulomyxa filosa]
DNPGTDAPVNITIKKEDEEGRRPTVIKNRSHSRSQSSSQLYVGEVEGEGTRPTGAPIELSEMNSVDATNIGPHPSDVIDLGSHSPDATEPGPHSPDAIELGPHSPDAVSAGNVITSGFKEDDELEEDDDMAEIAEIAAYAENAQNTKNGPTADKSPS